jgi:hypothetical protein
VGSVTGTDIPPEALGRVRRAAEGMLHEYFDGSPRSTRIVLTTYARDKAVMEVGPPGVPAPHPLGDSPVYVVVVEGDFRLRKGASHRTGCWVAIHVTPSLVARGFRGPAPRGGPGDRLIDLDLNMLGRVYEITDLQSWLAPVAEWDRLSQGGLRAWRSPCGSHRLRRHRRRPASPRTATHGRPQGRLPGRAPRQRRLDLHTAVIASQDTT